MASYHQRYQHRDPNKCVDCGGCGKKVHEVPCDLYPSGIVTEAYTCPTCLGSGRKPPTVADAKMAAAGDQR